METVTVIEYLVALVIGFYASVLAVVWLLEIRRNAMYRKMREKMACLEKLKLSMAVVKAKSYMIVENYRRDVTLIERVQQFVFENLLFAGRKRGRILR